MGLVIDFILHLDVHLTQLTMTYGTLMYVILFLIIFMETGFVVTPFLPGDSLLFATGALTALEGSQLEFKSIWLLLVLAAFLGDTTNYHIGRWLGPKVFNRPKSWLMNPSYLQEAHEFYELHGGKTVFFARFLPILRTFAPFVAGIALMERKQFFLMSISGSLLWMTTFLGAGFYFGNNPYVKSNFHLVIMAVILLSFIPVILGLIKKKRKQVKI